MLGKLPVHLPHANQITCKPIPIQENYQKKQKQNKT